MAMGHSFLQIRNYMWITCLLVLNCPFDIVFLFQISGHLRACNQLSDVL